MASRDYYNEGGDRPDPSRRSEYDQEGEYNRRPQPASYGGQQSYGNDDDQSEGRRREERRHEGGRFGDDGRQEGGFEERTSHHGGGRFEEGSRRQDNHGQYEGSNDVRYGDRPADSAYDDRRPHEQQGHRPGFQGYQDNEGEGGRRPRRDDDSGYEQQRPSDYESGQGRPGYGDQGSSYGNSGARPQGHSGSLGAFGGVSDDYSGAAEHAAQYSGSSGESDMFSSALGMLSGHKERLHNESLDESQAVQAHQQMYGGGGNGSPATNQTMGAAAAMQALKMFTGGQGGSPQGGAAQNQFIGMAMGQAAQLFDQQSAQGMTHPNANKQDAIASAAQMALKMFMKSQGGGGSGGGGGLLSLASRFLS